MQTASFRDWIRVAMYILIDESQYTSSALVVLYKTSGNQSYLYL